MQKTQNSRFQRRKWGLQIGCFQGHTGGHQNFCLFIGVMFLTFFSHLTKLYHCIFIYANCHHQVQRIRTPALPRSLYPALRTRCWVSPHLWNKCFRLGLNPRQWTNLECRQWWRRTSLDPVSQSVTQRSFTRLQIPLETPPAVPSSSVSPVSNDLLHLIKVVCQALFHSLKCFGQ